MEQKVNFWKSKRAAVYLMLILDLSYVIFVVMGSRIMPLGQRVQLLGIMLVATILYTVLDTPRWENPSVIPNSGRRWLIFGIWVCSFLLLLAPFRVDVNYATYQSFWYYESTYLPVFMFGWVGWQLIVSRIQFPASVDKESKLEVSSNEDQN